MCEVVFQGNSELYLSYDAPEIPANLPGKCVFPVCVCVYLVSVFYLFGMSPDRLYISLFGHANDVSCQRARFSVAPPPLDRPVRDLLLYISTRVLHTRDMPVRPGV